MPISLLDRRKAVAGAFVALLLLITIFAGQGFNPRQAEAATHNYTASEDICGTGGATFNVNVGDTVEIAESGTCTLLDASAWDSTWNTSFVDLGDGIYAVRIYIDEAGTVPGSYWDDGTFSQYSATIVATSAATLPHAPQNVTATAGDGQATVTFDAPADDGGAEITGYTVTSSPGNITATGASSPITVTGLTNGTYYTFTVTATNSVGTGNPSSPSDSVFPNGRPGAPLNVTAVAHAGYVEITFDPPASDGGNPIGYYTVRPSPWAPGAWGNSPIQVTGLEPGTTYTFTVAAVNAVGTGPDSAASNAVTTIGVPGQPTSVSAVAGNQQATVSFTAPASDGGSAITGYTVTSSPGGITATGASSPITVTGLTNGTEYTFTVTASNAIGAGQASLASNAVIPLGAPGAPQNVTAVAGNGHATVSYDPPASDGGNPIYSYRVTASPGGQSAFVAGNFAVVSGLTNGTEYTFTVVAWNMYGAGAASTPSNAVTPVGEPGAPQNVTAVAANGQATVSFDAPASNGGAAITGYTVTASPGDHQVTGTESPITVTGLTNGTKYFLTVTATNSVGTSEPSGADSATPLGAPGAPMHVTATAGNGQATVSFDAPASDGGSAITGYKVVASPGGKSATGVHSPITVEGLENGVTYTFTVTATNAIGTGEPSAPSSAVTPQGGTHIVLNSSPASSAFGQRFALVASVSADGTPTGTVTFFRGGEEIGTVELDANGDATLAIAGGYVPGSYSFRAVYSGSAAYESAESNLATHTVTKAPSTIELRVSHGSLLQGETITLTATVPMDVTGTVTFAANGKTIGQAAIVNGVASIEATFANVGDHQIVATSSGDANYLGSTDSDFVMVHAVPEETAPPTATPSPTPGETKTPETPGDTETPEPTPTPGTPSTPGNEPGNDGNDDGNDDDGTGSGLVESAPAGTTVIKVSNPGAFKVGDVIIINQGTPNEERRTIVDIDERGIVLNAGLDFGHDAGVSVVLSAGSAPIVPPATNPTETPAAGQPGAPLPPNAGTGLRILETGPLFALPLVLAVLLLGSGAIAYGARRQG